MADIATLASQIGQFASAAIRTAKSQLTVLGQLDLLDIRVLQTRRTGSTTCPRGTTQPRPLPRLNSLARLRQIYQAGPGRLPSISHFLQHAISADGAFFRWFVAGRAFLRHVKEGADALALVEPIEVQTKRDGWNTHGRAERVTARNGYWPLVIFFTYWAEGDAV